MSINMSGLSWFLRLCSHFSLQVDLASDHGCSLAFNVESDYYLCSLPISPHSPWRSQSLTARLSDRTDTWCFGDCCRRAGILGSHALLTRPATSSIGLVLMPLIGSSVSSLFPLMVAFLHEIQHTWKQLNFLVLPKQECLTSLFSLGPSSWI